MDTMTTSMVTFDTELGRCAVRWSDAGITRVLLPDPGGLPGPAYEDGVAVPGFVRDAIAGMQAVMAGTAVDLGDVPLDEGGLDDFRRAVYAATREIAAGTTRSYGEIARAIGRPDAARDVGVALSRNRVPDHRPVPSGRRRERGAHRVLGAGRPGHQATDARARGRARLRPAGAVRLSLRIPTR